MKRILEIDFLKGIAVILMIVFHFFYLSNFMSLSDFNIESGILYYIAKIAQIIFITLTGLNLYISNNSNKEKKKFYTKQLIRSGKLLLYGILISLITYKIFGENIYVKFGIIHFISASIFLSIPIVNSFGSILIVFGLIYIILLCKELLFSLCEYGQLTCFILGLRNTKYSSIDHFNFLHFYPFVLIGLLIGHLFYKKNITKFPKLANSVKKNTLVESITFTGKYSLNFYLSHFIVLYLYFKFMGGTPKKFIT